MTFTREQQRVYPVSSDLVIAAIHRVLSEGRRYELVGERPDGNFEVVYHPWFFLVASTHLVIRAEALAEATAVTVRTELPSVILGDVFNCYNRYIQAFFDALRERLQDA